MVVAHTFNPSTWATDVGRSTEFQNSQDGYTGLEKPKRESERLEGLERRLSSLEH